MLDGATVEADRVPTAKGFALDLGDASLKVSLAVARPAMLWNGDRLETCWRATYLRLARARTLRFVAMPAAPHAEPG